MPIRKGAKGKSTKELAKLRIQVFEKHGANQDSAKGKGQHETQQALV